MTTLPALLPVRAALFDLDGTLIETQIDFPAMTLAMLRAAAAVGIPEETMRGRDILGVVENAARILRERNENADEFRRDAFQILEAMEIAGCANPILLPGTVECLEYLTKSGISVGIVTRNCRTVSTRMLRQFGLSYDVLLTRDDVVRTKPNPEHLWDALRSLDCSASESLMAGDHWMDIQAGKAAGCAATVGVLGKNGPEHFAPCPPNLLVPDLAALHHLMADMHVRAR